MPVLPVEPWGKVTYQTLLLPDSVEQKWESLARNAVEKLLCDTQQAIN